MDYTTPPLLTNVAVSDTGLTVLHEGDNAIVDIVFVHGLQGHPRRTWATKDYPDSSQATEESDNSQRKGIRKFFSSRNRSKNKTGNTSLPKGKFWPLDLLPRDCPNSRILTWGYDSKVSNFFGGAANKSNLTAHARNLLQALKNNRRNCCGRSLIFIAHSLGGIIVKDLLRRAKIDRESAMIDIYTSTVGIMFLGTPHRGSGKARDAEVLERIVAVSGFDTAKQNIKALQINSMELELIHESFMHIYEFGDRRFEVITFQEAKGILGFGYSTLNGRIVEPFSSALTGNERTLTINADHMSMCRFHSESDEGYKQVVGEIESFITVIKKTQEQIALESSKSRPASSVAASSVACSFNDAERKCATSLAQNSEKEHNYIDSLPARLEGTCRWILSNSDFVDWKLRQSSCLLWINGYPGSGKTILSTFLTDYMSNGASSPSLRTALCYYLCNEKLETDATAILRSLIHQLIEQRKSLIKYVKASYDLYGLQFDQNLSELWKIFVAIAADKRMKPLSVIIDAMDECEETTRDRFMKYIFGLVHSPTTKNFPCIKFLVTSRPTVGHRYIVDSQINLSPNEIEPDLNLVIKAKVEGIVGRIKCKPEIGVYLEQTLLEKADKTFLWVTLVLLLLEKTILASKKDLKLIIDRLPKTLAETYESFLRQIPEDCQDLASRILHFVVGSYRPITLEEMRTFLALDDQHHTTADMDEDLQPNIRKTIEEILGPLIRISDSQIYLVHLSLKEFLQELSTKCHPYSHIYGIEQHNASLACLQACVTYLRLDDFKKDLFTTDKTDKESLCGSLILPFSDDEAWKPPESPDSAQHFGILGDLFKDPINLTLSDIAKRYPLFDYAARHWAKHCVSAGDIPSVLQESIFLLSDATKAQGSNWLRYYWTFAETELSFPRDFDPIVTASYFGYLPSLSSVSALRSTRIDAYTGAEAIFWASRMGCDNVVDVLLKGAVNPDMRIENRRSPLTAAVQYNFPQVVKLLLVDDGFISEEQGYRVNFRSVGGRTPLSIAAGNGFLEIVQLLLNHKRIIPDIADSSQCTPLFWAVGGGHFDILDILLSDGRISVNHTDKTGRNVLSWAAAEGQLEMVRYLMSHTNIMADEKDKNGRTALSLAAGNGDLEMTQYLRSTNKFQVSSKDNDGRNIISWACGSGNYEVVEYLIQFDPEGADDKDVSGWTPLSWALFRDTPRVVHTLLSSGLVDANKKDRAGRSPLSFAAGYGYEEVVKIFLKTEGIDINSKDNGGRMPINWAEPGSNIEKMLRDASIGQQHDRNRNVDET